MRKYFIGIFAFALLTLSIVSKPVFAQMITPQSVIDEVLNGVKPINPEGITNISDVSVLVPSFENKIYHKGDIVKIVLPLKNNDKVDYPDLTLSAYISVYTEDGKIKEYGYKNNLIDIFIPKETNKDVTFEFKIPDSISYSEGDTVRLEIQVLQKTGQLIGVTGNFIKLGDFGKTVEIMNSFIKINDKKYELQEGPTLSSEEKIYQVISVINETDKDIVLYPKLKVYDLQPSRSIVETKNYELITVKNSKDVQEFIFELPQITKSGIYTGELSFFDVQGFEQTQFVTSRWIIEGDIVTIPSVTIDKTTFKKGETASVKVVYTGAPVDIDTQTKREVGMGILKVSFYNEDNELIGNQEKEVNFSTFRDTALFEIISNKASSKIKVEVIASKNGKELAYYSTNLSNPEQVPKQNALIDSLISIIVIIFILIVALFIYKKVKNKKIIEVSFFMLTFLGITHVSEAGTACYTKPSRSYLVEQNPFCATTDLNKRNFLPGEDMGWNVPVTVTAEVCGNQPKNTQVDWIISNGYTGWFNNAYGIDSYKNIYTHNFPTFYPNNAGTYGNRMSAPSVPGTYVLTLLTYVRGTFEEYGSDTPDFRYYNLGPVRFDYTFTVSCPNGQVYLNGSCQSPPPPTPTGLTATPGPCGNTWLTITWNASAGATNYKVYRGVTKIYDGSLLTYTDTGLTLWSTYSYTITATNAGGTSAVSSPAVSGTVSSVCNYTLTINTAGTGGGTTTGAGTYTSWASVTATATPNATSTFTGWSGDCNASGQVTMNANKTCVATFTRIPITANCSPSPASATTGQPITWTANNVLGGIGNYTYFWSGDDNLSGTTNPLSKTYTTAGAKNASVIITSGTQTTSVSCPAATVTAITDMCDNIEDIQTTIPAGLHRDIAGNCVCGSGN